MDIQHSIRKCPSKNAPQVSFAQERFWLLDQLAGSSTSYSASKALRLRGPLLPMILEKSINEIVRRHEILRTTFTISENAVVQTVSPKLTIMLPIMNLTALRRATRESEVIRLAQEEAGLPFELDLGPLLRVRLLQLGIRDHILFLTFHHIIFDGWSVGIFNRELSILYDTFAEGRNPKLPELPIQYADFAYWQRTWFQGEALEEQIAFWRTHLTGALPIVELPADYSRPQLITFKGGWLSSLLPATLINKAEALSKSEYATLFVTLFTVLQILLARWTRQHDLVVGTVVANRNRIETENLIGCFTNFLPLRCIVPKDGTGRHLLQQMKSIVFQSYRYQNCPFDRLVRDINPSRLHGRPFYNIAFLLQNFPSRAFSSHTLSCEVTGIKRPMAHMDLRFVLTQGCRGTIVECEYQAAIFDTQTIKEILRSYHLILMQLVREPEKRISDFTLSQGLDAQAAKMRPNQ